jgi:hypothetical protein
LSSRRNPSFLHHHVLLSTPLLSQDFEIIPCMGIIGVDLQHLGAVRNGSIMLLFSNRGGASGEVVFRIAGPHRYQAAP